MRTRHKPEPGVLVLDFRPLVEAFHRFGRALSAAGRMIRDAFDTRLHARRRVGGAGDPRTGDWQSGPCSGWLHDDCPTPATTGCACTCHGGHLR